jgi:hypothetical protein
MTTSNAAFSPATSRPENSFFGCPHHRHDTLATVVGLPQAEQTFTCRMEVVFLGKRHTLNALSAEMLRYNATERSDPSRLSFDHFVAFKAAPLPAFLPTRRPRLH